MRVRARVVPFALLVAACHDGTRNAPPSTTQPSTTLRAADAEVHGGHSDLLAATLLIAGGTPIQHGGRATFMVRDSRLEERLLFHAHAHVEASALGAGAQGGASIAGSARIRRLALAPDAPADRNGNGTNLDETADEETARLCDLAGAEGIVGAYGAMMPWRVSTATLLGAPGGRDAFDALRVAGAPRAQQQVDAGQIGGAMLARLHAAARLLEHGRGSRPGADPRAGSIGLSLLQQVIAMEETLIGALFGRDGVLSGLRDARTYAPGSPAEALWVPARIQVVEEERLPGAPAAFVVIDRASSLVGLASLLEVAADLAWLASERNANPTLRDLLNGFPFGSPPDRRRGRGGASPTAGGGEEVAFSRDIKPILEANCIVCHNDQTPTNGFSMGRAFPPLADYDKVLTPGNVGRLGTPPHVTPGDRRQSLLWLVLNQSVGEVQRMPRGCGDEFFPCLPSGQISLVGDWIDQGLRREPSEPQPPPKIGEDLARVLLRNVELLHLEPDGALADRFDGEARSGIVSARSTGATLSALANALAALPPDDDARALLARAAAFAADHLVDEAGVVVAELLPDGAARRAGPPADALAHAALSAGLFAAARVLDDETIRARARATAAAWLQRFWNDAESLFRLRVGDDRLQADAAGIAGVLRALQEAADDGVAGAQHAHDALVVRLLPVVVASEWEGLGEVLDDGDSDTDGNGIAEPALAGGPFGRAPLLLGEVRFGPDPEPEEGPVSWSEVLAPLFRSKCAGCHVDGAAEGGYRVDTPTAAARAGESGWTGRLVVPGDPEQSLLYRKLVDRRPPVGQQMPLLRTPLDDRARELVRRWIAEGALDR